MLFRKFVKYLIFLFGICIILGYLFLAFSSMDNNFVPTDHVKKVRSTGNDCPTKDNHKLCLVVPFRDRFDELLEFTPHMKKFLCKQGIENEIVIVNQGDSLRFNRGSLINIGYLISANELKCDYIAMHDVDLLPCNNQLSYSYPENNPFHVAAPNLHPKYHYKNFVGGILLIKNEHFENVNGLSNRFWGWGREDDEFFVRLKKAKLQVERPVNITTGNATFRHMHGKYRRPRDYTRFGDQIIKSKQRDNATGFSTVSYTELSRHKLLIDNFSVLVVNIELSCNVYDTPWCMEYKQLVNYVKEMKFKMSPSNFKNLIQVLNDHNIEIS